MTTGRKGAGPATILEAQAAVELAKALTGSPWFSHICCQELILLLLLSYQMLSWLTTDGRNICGDSTNAPTITIQEHDNIGSSHMQFGDKNLHEY